MEMWRWSAGDGDTYRIRSASPETARSRRSLSLGEETESSPASSAIRDTPDRNTSIRSQITPRVSVRDDSSLVTLPHSSAQARRVTLNAAPARPGDRETRAHDKHTHTHTHTHTLSLSLSHTHSHTHTHIHTHSLSHTHTHTHTQRKSTASSRLSCSKSRSNNQELSQNIQISTFSSYTLLLRVLQAMPQRNIQSENISFLPVYNLKNLLSPQSFFRC